MPEQRESEGAADVVAAWLQAFENTRTLSIEECSSYDGRSIRRGWSIDLRGDPEVQSEVRVLLPDLFPYARPLVAVSEDNFLLWPHVEEDGVLCALPLASSIDPLQPLQVTRFILNAALGVIKLGLSGVEADFQDEFNSYWDRARSIGTPPVISLLADFGGPRLVSAHFGDTEIVVAETDIALNRWMDSRKGLSEKRSLEKVLLLNLAQALVPRQYPRHSWDLRKLVDLLDLKAVEALGKRLRDQDSRNTILLHAPTSNGPALAALEIGVPPSFDRSGHAIDKPQNGFRPGRTPPRLWMRRYFAYSPNPRRLKVKRADAHWIHGRDKDPRMSGLSKKRVLLLGVGSIGSFVAEMLVASGVGSLQLVDPETLTFANASRHLLGVDSEGKNKAVAVAELLQRRFPHHVVNGTAMDGQAFCRKAFSDGTSFDLILSLTGDWELDCFLNYQLLTAELNPFVQMLFGWAEPYAVAGHAVLLSERSSCLQCHFSANGLPDLSVAVWDGETMPSEPACGGQFQPYGIVDIMSINSMIASLALDGLLGETRGNIHKVYASADARITQSSGKVSADWCQVRGAISGDHAVVVNREWLPGATCMHNGVECDS